MKFRKLILNDRTQAAQILCLCSNLPSFYMPSITHKQNCLSSQKRYYQSLPWHKIPIVPKFGLGTKKICILTTLNSDKQPFLIKLFSFARILHNLCIQFNFQKLYGGEIHLSTNSYQDLIFAKIFCNFMDLNRIFGWQCQEFLE